MRHPFQEVLASRERSTSQLIPAVISKAIADGTGDYYCIRSDTRKTVRASVAKAGDTFALRTPVLLLKIDDGTMASTTGYVISQLRTFAALGSVSAVPTDGEEDNDGSAVVMLDPTIPASLSIAASLFAIITGPFYIYGVGLGDVSISVNDANIALDVLTRTDSRIAYQAVVQPGSGSRLGSRDLTVDGKTFPDYFHVGY